MINLSKILLTALILFSTLNAKNYFINQNDICDTQLNEKCTNNVNVIRNLQITLTHDKYTDTYLKADGKWGKTTKEAVIAFQTMHDIQPADGWVGKSTKEELDKIAKNITFPKNIKIAKVAVQKTKTSNQNISNVKNNKLAKNKLNVDVCKSYAVFKKNVNLRKSYKVFKDNKLLCKANGRNTHLKIDVSEQRVKLLVNGKIALSAPCTTGAKHKLEPNTKTYRDKHTPLGTFKIMEKIAAKKSTIFGEMYRNGKKVYHGDRRKYKGPKAKYVGHTMHNWMRLTSGGVGLHASKYVKRYPGSNGCVRLQPKIAKLIFKKVRRGTKVSVVN